MKAFLFSLMMVVGLVGYAHAQQQLDIDWMMEDVLGEELIDLSSPLLTTPEELKKAVENYTRGEYRKASVRLQQLASLHLPDGREDYVSMLLAESYRQMSCMEPAIMHYRKVSSTPGSDLSAAALFRILEYAYTQRDEETGDSILTLFTTKYRKHPIITAAVYTGGKLYFRSHRYGEAISLLNTIPSHSSVYFHAQFILSLCYIRVDKIDMALSILETLFRTCTNKQILGEVDITIGDILYGKEKIDAALNYYLSVPRKSNRYHSARVKCARIYLDKGELEKAAELAESYLKEYPQGEYFFEMASLVAQIYATKKEKEDQTRIHALMYQKVVNARTASQLIRELEEISEMKHAWKNTLYEAAQKNDKKNEHEITQYIEKLHLLENRAKKSLYDLDMFPVEENRKQIKGLALRRYMRLLEKRIESQKEKQQRHDNKSPGTELGRAARSSVREKEKPTDESGKPETLLAALEKEYEILQNAGACMDAFSETDVSRKNAKYIDWSYMHYKRQKQSIHEMSVVSSEGGQEKPNEKAGLEKIRNAFAKNQRSKIAKEVQGERQNLIKHLQMLLEASMGSHYNASYLFRLAELYYDEASERFDSQLREYEKKMAEGSDTSKLAFPQFDMRKVIHTYDRILSDYPQDGLADDAAFYKAQALRKEGKEKKANDVLLMLNDTYPESEYYVEANMAVGRYFFNHPKVHQNHGYKLAEEAFRRVLYYRDHPQFVEAL